MERTTCKILLLYVYKIPYFLLFVRLQLFLSAYVFVYLDLQDFQAINIILNPGLAFGTGEHPTTKLCLLLLRRLIKGGEHFLDYGTGSGVLAIAALKVPNVKTMYIQLLRTCAAGIINAR